MKTLLGMTLLLCATTALAQNCPDTADESHHELLFENKQVRIFRLELSRLASTEMHCHSGGYYRVVVTDSQTTDTLSGDAPVLHDWHPGSTRWMFPTRHKARNDSNRPHREYIVESKRSAPYNPLDGNYDQDEFSADAPTPDWTAVSHRGALIARKVQLAAGSAIDVPPPDFLLIALNDIVLSDGKAGSEPVRLSKGDYRLVDGGKMRTLKNAGSAPARFITVEF